MLRFSGFAFLENPPRLDRTASDSYIAVEFPPQSFGEEAFLQTIGQDAEAAGQQEVTADKNYPPQNIAGTEDAVPGVLPVARVRMAAASRIVVSMPDEQSSIAFDLPTILGALRDWPMRRASGAVPEPSGGQISFDWIGKLVRDPALVSLKNETSGFLSQLAGSAPENAASLTNAIAQSGIQLAQQAVSMLSGASTTSGNESAHVTAVLRQNLLSSAAALEQQYPALRGDAARTASLTALSMAALESFSVFGQASPGAVTRLPTLPFFTLLLGPQEPPDSVTALELPYRVITSPLEPARWAHSITPVTRNGHTELWHTRLSSGSSGTGPGAPGRMRAIWSPDYRPQSELPTLYQVISLPGPPPGRPNPDVIRMSLDPVDRSMLVTLMAGFDATPSKGNSYSPIGSEAKRLHLSALGALLDAEGNWEVRPEGIDLEQWRHLASLGRDHYVRVVYAGFLCPFGHAASLVKVTERRFEPLGKDGPGRIAVLRQRFFLLVRQQRRSYDGTNSPNNGRDFPFTSVEILTRITPDLMDPGVVGTASHVAADPTAGDPYQNPTIEARMLFWPMVPTSDPNNPADVMFDIAATDLVGNRVTFSMPLMFVGDPANQNTNTTSNLIAAYNAAQPEPKLRTSLGGSVVAYAPGTDADKGDTKLPTADITLHAGPVTVHDNTNPNFYPQIYRANVGIKPVQKLLGKPGFISEVTYPKFYSENGFDATANAGQVFLQFTSSQALNFGGGTDQAKSDTLGALASPQMNLLGLSKLAGPVAGKTASTADQVLTALGNVKNSTFDPTDFFNNATLLGGIDLGAIVQKSASLAGEEVPKILSRDFPDRVEASFDWSTTVVGSDPAGLIIPRADPSGPDTRLVMSGIVTTPIQSAASPTIQASATLNNFKVNLFGFIILWFEKLEFNAKRGQKPDVSVQLRDGQDAVTFGGPLEFVNALRQVIPGNGFSDPPAIQVTPSGIGASYSLTLPTIGVGVFVLSNVSLGASFSLPFDATPARVNFYFSQREHPFSLAVSMIGGGGFFGIGISSAGVNEIEAALEFGAMVAIDLGVASGSVEIKAGVYFHWLEPTPGQGTVELAGYVRIHGELCVLALISVSLTFNLQLGYQKAGNSSIVYGEAQLTVEIDILMFSTSVSVRCRREFAGSAGDPKFIDQVPNEQVWADYCDAFAVEAV
ncbi:hypothetical protein AB3X94_29840 [Paraburkholderia sp. BR10923]|uniref:Uncharacterized protein n=1 Tax=Paraburkholderia youngii TaxID=2782701 RepID=A0A7Y6JWV8_9BURK|nr:hypothetical protein [Paraburkholderia youngii]NUX99773.1 hypothetical protein [Paraburkholderia youngii]